MSEIIVVLAAIFIALLMVVKPEMFVLNEKHRTPKFVRSIKFIGMSVAIVLLALFAAEYLF